MEVTLYVQIKTILSSRYPDYLIYKISFGHLSGISIYEALHILREWIRDKWRQISSKVAISVKMWKSNVFDGKRTKQSGFQS